MPGRTAFEVEIEIPSMYDVAAIREARDRLLADIAANGPEKACTCGQLFWTENGGMRLKMRVFTGAAAQHLFREIRVAARMQTEQEAQPAPSRQILEFQMACPECGCTALNIASLQMPPDSERPNLTECTGCHYQGRNDEFMLDPHTRSKRASE